MEVKEALKLVDRLSSLVEIRSEKERIVTAFIHEYFAELLQFEELEAEIYTRNRSVERDNREDTFKYLNNKREIHNRYWSNKAAFYLPSSSGSEPAHDWSKVADIQIMETGDDDLPQFIFMCRYLDHTPVRKAFLIQIKNGKLSIEHEFFG